MKRLNAEEILLCLGAHEVTFTTVADVSIFVIVITIRFKGGSIKLSERVIFTKTNF